MTADLDDIDAALFAQLSTLAASANPAGPFATVARWTGELPRPEEITAETFGKAPAAVLAFGEETAGADLLTLPGDSEDAAESTWLVFVVVEDPRGATRVAKGSTGLKGSLKLASTVAAKLNALIVPAPAATLTFAVTGTPDTTVALGSATLSIGAFRFAPTTTSIVIDHGGAGTIDATCVTPNTLGNLALGLVATWSATIPDLAATATISAVATAGVEGTLRGERIHYRGARPIVLPGRLAIMALRFSARRSVGDAALPDDSTDFTELRVGLDLVEPPPAPNPILELKITP